MYSSILDSYKCLNDINNDIIAKQKDIIATLKAMVSARDKRIALLEEQTDLLKKRLAMSDDVMALTLELIDELESTIESMKDPETHDFLVAMNDLRIPTNLNKDDNDNGIAPHHGTTLTEDELHRRHRRSNRKEKKKVTRYKWDMYIDDTASEVKHMTNRAVRHEDLPHHKGNAYRKVGSAHIYLGGF